MVDEKLSFFSSNNDFILNRVNDIYSNNLKSLYAFYTFSLGFWQKAFPKFETNTARESFNLWCKKVVLVVVYEEVFSSFFLLRKLWQYF